MAKRRESESFHLGVAAKHNLEQLKARTGINKSQLVRQGVALVTLCHELGISPILYARAGNSLKEAGGTISAYLQELGGCDHAAGICYCGEKAVLDGIKETLKDMGVKEDAV